MTARTACCFGWSLRRRWVVVVVCLLIVASTVPLAMGLGANLVPRDDQSEFQIAIRTPEGYTLDRSDRLTREIEGRLTQLPGVVRTFTTIGQKTGRGEGDVTKISIYMRLKDLDQRKYCQFAVMDRARNILKDYPDLRTAVNDVATITGNGGDGDTRNFNLNIMGPEIDKLADYADQVKRKLTQIPGLLDVDTTLSLRKPELQVAVDRERASDLGIPVETIADTLKVLVGGEPVSRYKEGTSNTTSGCGPTSRSARTRNRSRPCKSLRPTPASCSWPASRGSARRRGPARSTVSTGNGPCRFWPTRTAFRSTRRSARPATS